MNVVNQLKKDLYTRGKGMLRDRATIELAERLEALEAVCNKEYIDGKIDGDLAELKSRMKRLEHLIAHIVGPVDGKKT